MAQALEIRILGELEVLRDGEPVPLPASRKTRGLLAYLVMTGRAHRRERLCEMLWEIPDDPRGALRWSLAKIRRLVDDSETQRIVATRDAVGFEPHDARIDLWDLRRAVRDIDGMTAEQLIELAGLMRGECLDGGDMPNCPGFQSWLVSEREEVRGARRRILAALVGASGDDPDNALEAARRLVAVDPHDESAQLALLRLLVKAGRVREARDQLQVAMRLVGTCDAGAASRLAFQMRSIAATAGQPAVADASRPPAAIVAGQASQTIRFCVARDGARIAYSVAGDGPPLLKAANWLNHLEYDWRSPIWRHLMDLLVERHTLVRYDERGNGLSDVNVSEISFEAFVADLEAVVDASGIDRFPLVGISQGCAVAIAYAVRHPQRVTRLVLHGGYALGWRSRRDPDEIAAREALMTLIRTGWGRSNPAFRQVFTSLFFPDATAEQVEWFNELQRVSTTPANAVRLLTAMGDIDVTNLLGRVAVPTLVTHCTGDARVAFEVGRNLAKGIPGARFVQLESRNHLMLAHEPAWARFAAEVRAFVADGR
jgi:DNA-binding SARP family transcriptional activator/pimeloyl-ACP methyl ester carboxylesterase